MKINKELVIALVGPTASGKTALAIELAEYLKLEIHNIDSKQVYIGMDIGTAKPTKIQRERVEHFLIDLCHPNQQLTLHGFTEKANKSIKKNLLNKRISFLVGGSGLYLKAITGGLQPPAVPPQKILREQLNKMNPQECHQILEKCDPITAEKVSPADSMRIIRALEVFYATGKTLSSQKITNPPSWNLLELGLNPTNLETKIKNRTNNMYASGLIDETKQLINQFGENLPLLKTIGYQEALCIIKGSISSNEGISITNQRTKNFAKRQRTWFKNQHSPIWLNEENAFKESIALIQEAIGCIN